MNILIRSARPKLSAVAVLGAIGLLFSTASMTVFAEGFADGASASTVQVAAPWRTTALSLAMTTPEKSPGNCDMTTTLSAGAFQV